MEKLYDPKMNQREFMLKALQSEDKLKPRDVLAFWKQRLDENCSRPVVGGDFARFHQILCDCAFFSLGLKASLGTWVLLDLAPLSGLKTSRRWA